MLQEVMNYISSVFTAQDQIGLAAMAVIVLVAGLMLGGFSSIVRFTLGALAVFGIAMIGRKILMDGGEPVGTVQQTGEQFLQLSMGTFLVYFVAFAVVIAAIYLVKSTVQRNH